MTRRQAVGLIAVALFAMAPRPSASTVSNTDSLYWARRPDVDHSFTGAVFVPSIAPVPTKTIRGVNAALQWNEVTVNSGAVVQYKVMRILTDGSSLEVCTGADVPITSGGIVTCMDRKPPTGTRYTEQPYIVGGAAVMTWSLSPSAMSNS